MRPRLALAALLLAGPAAGGEIRGALVTLEVQEPARAGREPTAAPLRFALLDRGRVFVGGTSAVWEGRLDGEARDDVEDLVERVLDQRGLPSELQLGPGDTRYRLYFGERDVWVVATGDPARAPAAYRRVAELIAALVDFDHYSLRPWQPETLLLGARRGELRGGCRAWSFDLDLEAVTRHATAIPGRVASGWPTGARPASVCHAGVRYVVTLRPLLPGES